MIMNAVRGGVVLATGNGINTSVAIALLHV